MHKIIYIAVLIKEDSSSHHILKAFKSDKKCAEFCMKEQEKTPKGWLVIMTPTVLMEEK